MKLEKFVESEIRKRWEEKEAERKYGVFRYEVENVCWDISFDNFSNKIIKSVVSIAKNERESEIALDAIFNEVEFNYKDSHGNHHMGFYISCYADTTKASELAKNPSKLRKIINETYEVKVK